MPAMMPLSQGEEVFYRYGSYTNAELLVLYGFVVPGDLTRESASVGLRIHARLSEIDPLSATTPKQEAEELWRLLACSKFQMIAFDFRGQLLVKHSRWFPACSRLHYFLYAGGDVNLTVSNRRLHSWPAPVQEVDASWKEA